MFAFIFYENVSIKDIFHMITLFQPQQECPNLTIDFVFLVFVGSFIEVAKETKDLLLPTFNHPKFYCLL